MFPPDPDNTSDWLIFKLYTRTHSDKERLCKPDNRQATFSHPMCAFNVFSTWSTRIEPITGKGHDLAIRLFCQVPETWTFVRRYITNMVDVKLRCFEKFNPDKICKSLTWHIVLQKKILIAVKKKKLVVSSCHTFNKFRIQFVFYAVYSTDCNFKVCKSVHHHTIQINHQPDATISPVYDPHVYLQLNMFRVSSCPSSGAQLQ